MSLAEVRQGQVAQDYRDDDEQDEDHDFIPLIVLASTQQLSEGLPPQAPCFIAGNTKVLEYTPHSV